MSLPEQHPSRPGDILLGKYRVESILGRGGMGVVVAARHLTLDERVAIKFLLPEHVGDTQLVQRFLREARAAVRIRSQHVARVTDVGTMENGAPYMIMEHLEGMNLAALIAESGRLPIPLAVELVLQACEALAEAHAQGIVHRDVKPSNLFLTHHADGAPCVKVLDFGIAKMRSAQDHALTRTGGVLGSPLYMSPEQLRSSRDVDARADVYSVGVVLFELLTTRLPFIADELAQLVYKIMNDEPLRPSALRGDIPEPLEGILLKALARDRDGRFASVAELAMALAPYAPSHARQSVERICAVLRARTADGVESQPGRGSSPASVASGQVTTRLAEAATLADSATLTSISPLRGAHVNADRRSRWKAAIAVAACAVGLGAAFVTWRQAAPAAPVATATAAREGVPPRVALPSAMVAVPIPAVPVAADGASAKAMPSASASASSRKLPSPPAAPVPPPRRVAPRTDPFKRDVF